MKKRPENLCPLCGGRKKEGYTTYSADLGVGVIVVRHVPATICEQCGEAWIDPKTAQRLETVSNEARSKKTQVEVVAL
jgi:YgiT-type zinc finger domain-containing protein